MQRTSSITHKRNVSIVGIMEYTGSFLIIVFRSLLTGYRNSLKWKNTVSFIYAEYDPGVDSSELAKRIDLSVEKVKSKTPSSKEKKSKELL